MELFSALFRYTSVPMAVFQRDGYQIQTVNDAWRQFWDVTSPSVDGEQLADVLSDEATRLHQQLLDRVRTSGQSEAVAEAAVSVCQDASYRYVNILASLVPPTDQQAGCIGLITTDVTEIVLARLRADRLALEQEAQTRMMQDALDNSPVAIVITRSIRDQTTRQIIDFEYLLANRESDRLSNLPPGEQLTNRRLLDTFPGDVSSGIFDQFCQVVETGEPLAVESHYQHGPTDRWFYVRTVRHGDGFIQTTLDITLVKEAEAAVQRQRDLLQTILDNSQTAISLHNALRDETGQIVDFKTILANRRAYAMWGNSAGQVVNQTFMSLRPGPDAQPDFDRYVSVVEQGNPARFDFNLNNRLYSINIARAGDGVVLSSVDITSDRQYQQQLEQINAELKRSNENLQAFAYIASHDLQEPLRKIISFSSILTDQYNAQLNHDGQDILRRMRLSAERMSALIRDLLAYARIGSQHEPFRPVDLQQLLHELIDDMDLAADPTEVTVQVGFLPQVPGDRLLLRQLFQNLVSNAVKFRRTDVPPVVQIDSERITDDQLPPSLPTHPGGYWAIRVTDNGIGFASEYADRIFQVFQRLHGRSQYNGTGIGLAIVRKVAEQHGGLVVAESKPGVGSTFSIYLPAQRVKG